MRLSCAMACPYWYRVNHCQLKVAESHWYQICPLWEGEGSLSTHPSLWGLRGARSLSTAPYLWGAGGEWSPSVAPCHSCLVMSCCVRTVRWHQVRVCVMQAGTRSRNEPGQHVQCGGAKVCHCQHNHHHFCRQPQVSGQTSPRYCSGPWEVWGAGGKVGGGVQSSPVHSAC